MAAESVELTIPLSTATTDKSHSNTPALPAPAKRLKRSICAHLTSKFGSAPSGLRRVFLKHCTNGGGSASVESLARGLRALGVPGPCATTDAVRALFAPVRYYFGLSCCSRACSHAPCCVHRRALVQFRTPRLPASLTMWQMLEPDQPHRQCPHSTNRRTCRPLVSVVPLLPPPAPRTGPRPRTTPSLRPLLQRQLPRQHQKVPPHGIAVCVRLSSLYNRRHVTK